jgi:outer membrane protein assembly factor BamB
MVFRLTIAAFLVALSPLAAQEPWSTFRGNAQRTGSADGKAGPANAKVLWSYASKDHYIASPVPVGDKLIVSGLGAFNTGTMSCLSLDPKAKQRVEWTKGTPFLKLPTVSSPAVFGNRIIFGEGMHQTDGAQLYCIQATNGLPLWTFQAPGSLVHLEGSPTIVDGKAYIGGGAAGVICVATDKASLDGKEFDLASLQKELGSRWEKLVAKYESDKIKDPMFAIPPSEDQLAKASPQRVWEQGKEKWHVDAPVGVAKGKVVVASAFLDKEKVGDRAIICLDAADGKILWRTPLKLNPWGGPSIDGDTVVITGSSINYDPKLLKGAKGFVAAYKLSDGKEIWHKDLPGGALGCAAIIDGAVIVTATDGKVRAFELASGERRWIYETKTPFFAPVAAAGNTAYAADILGVVHAIELKGGTSPWKLDLGAGDLKSPGMVYGGPILHQGRLYIATSNLEGPNARGATAVVCIGE